MLLRSSLFTALCLFSMAPTLSMADNIIRQSAPIKAVMGGVETPPEETTDPEAPPEDTAGEKSRYWRLLFTANNGHAGNYVGLQELELRSEPGGADLTNPQTAVSASSWYTKDDLRPLKVIDNNYTEFLHAFWLSAAGAIYPHWLSLDLGSEQKVVEVTLWPQNYAGTITRTPKDFDIQASPDGVTWHTVKAVRGMTNWMVGYPQIIEIE